MSNAKAGTATKLEEVKKGVADADGGTAVAAPANTAVGQAMDFAADAGAGMEGADADSYAIPFLLVLQPMSPQVVDGIVAGAKPGIYLNSVTNEVYGETGFFVPVAFKRNFIRWGARETGGGFKGEFTVAQAQELRASGTVKELDG